MKDLISRKPYLANSKHGTSLIPVTRVKRILASKYSKTYTELAKLVDENNKKGVITRV